jgi:hypothetical protein
MTRLDLQLVAFTVIAAVATVVPLGLAGRLAWERR